MDRLKFRPALARFGRKEDGNIAIETVIVLPILFWAFLTMFSIFDTYRQYAINQKAAYTIGDLVSRQTNALDQNFMTGTRSLFDYLTRNESESTMRVTSVKYDLAQDKYIRDWSQAIGWQVPATVEQVEGWRDRLPIMPDQEHITVVETWSHFDPPFNISLGEGGGLGQREIVNYVFTRPRYAPRIIWSGS